MNTATVNQGVVGSSPTSGASTKQHKIGLAAIRGLSFYRLRKVACVPKTRLQPVSAPPLAWQAGWRPLAGHAMAAPLRAAQGAGVRGGLGPRAAPAAGLLLRSALAGA
ncbi:hypothetical protein [Xylella fastidiosa]|uniref:hypothetical protein n=1 Tax=Xylella fastidiosa TaxID=2371 RepID=UPI0013E3359B|nr:hypothetical protein [Xylella fastidiosa]